MNEAEKKADEIIEMYFSVNDIKGLDRATNPFISSEFAKQCALIHVNGIIEVLQNKHNKTINRHTHLSYTDDGGFWQEVKTIIENK